MKYFKVVLTILLIVMLTVSMVGCKTDANAGTLKDGKYTGQGEGKGGIITVEVTVENGKVAKIDVVEHHETEGLCDAPMQEIIDNVIESNSFNVDTVSGATLTSQGLLEAIKVALIEAGATSDMQGDATNSGSEQTAQTDTTYDVVVIGGGGAGLTAAIEAKNAGANVVVLEKMSFVGGNTLISGGEFAASGNWLQKEEGLEDSVEQHFEDTMKGGDYKNDEALVRKLAENALPTAEWLKDYVGVEFEDHLFQFGGHSVKRSLVPKGATAVELVNKLKAKVEELEIPVKVNTKAVELILDENSKVVGVKAENKDGQEITFTANNGVVLASGGFGANVELRKRFNPIYDENYLTTNSVGATGDGIVMGEAIGADLVGTEYIQTYPICDPLSGMLLYTDDARFYSTILVNKEGNRFVEELDRRDIVSQAMVAQTESCAYELWDQSNTEISHIVENHKAEMDYLYKNNLLAQVDTIKEAADFFGIDAEQLEKSVERFNEFAKNGKDEDFNKRGNMTPIEKAPFYIMKSVPSVHHTMGGIKIDVDAHVINSDGNIIEGLYAAGEVTGGVHGTNRLGSNAIADISVFGKIAGKNAAEMK